MKRHWHILLRVRGGKNKKLPGAHATAEDAFETRGAMQQIANVSTLPGKTPRSYGITSCENRNCTVGTSGDRSTDGYRGALRSQRNCLLASTGGLSVKKYRIVGKYKNWVGKPDPSGFGTFFIETDDPSWAHEEALRRRRRGDKVLKIQRNDGDGNWRTM